MVTTLFVFLRQDDEARNCGAVCVSMGAVHPQPHDSTRGKFSSWEDMLSAFVNTHVAPISTSAADSISSKLGEHLKRISHVTHPPPAWGAMAPTAPPAWGAMAPTAPAAWGPMAPTAWGPRPRKYFEETKSSAEIGPQSGEVRVQQHLIRHAMQRANALALQCGITCGIEGWIDTPVVDSLLVESSLLWTQGINGMLQRVLTVERKRTPGPSPAWSKLTEAGTRAQIAALWMCFMAANMVTPETQVVWRGQQRDASNVEIKVWSAAGRSEQGRGKPRQRAVWVTQQRAQQMGYVYHPTSNRVGLTKKAWNALPAHARQTSRWSSEPLPTDGLTFPVKAPHPATDATIGVTRRVGVAPRHRWDLVAPGETHTIGQFMSTSLSHATGVRFAVKNPTASTTDRATRATEPQLLKVIITKGTHAVPVFLLGSMYGDRDESEIALAPGTELEVLEHTTYKGLPLTVLRTIPHKLAPFQVTAGFRSLMQYQIEQDFVASYLMKYIRLQPSSRRYQLQSMFEAKWIDHMYTQLFGQTQAKTDRMHNTQAARADKELAAFVAWWQLTSRR